MRSRGFTLIEVLVVIAIIGILASIVLATLSAARPKAYDARRKVELKSLVTAIQAYYIQYNKYPDNLNCYDGVTHVVGTPGCPGGFSKFGVCDQPTTAINGGMDTNNFPAAYNATMQELVDAKLLPYIPHDPGGSAYCYYDFGRGIPSGATEQAGAIFATILQSANQSTLGYPPTCRPWPSGIDTWCSRDNTLQYCMCNPY